MRILHIAQSVSGGIASYFEEVAAFQARHYGTAAVRFLIPAGNGHHLPSIDPAQIAEFSPCDRNAKGLLALGLATHREISSFAPTIVHIHSTFAGAVSRPAILLSGRNPQIVYCPHGWVFAMEIPQWKRKLFSLIEKCLVPLTDAIVNISHTDHKLALSTGIRADKMVTIRNGIAAHPPLGHAPRIEFQKNRINLIFVGRHDRQKGLDYLLDVFSRANVPGLHLHVVGAPVVESAVGLAAADTPSNVTFYGWQPRDEVSKMIACADALIMPSRWEGFGLVALEAMRLGKPVLASRRGALPEIIEDGKTGLLFDLERRSELADILSGVKKNTLVEMGVAARDEFQRTFTSERLNAELVSLYRSLENGSRQKTLWRTLRKSALPRVLPFGIALFEILGIGSSGSLMEWMTCCQL
jgi:glycosyltransferase involved in cell wall biosynthesis